MKYRILGRTGLKVSEIGFGTAPAGISDYLGPWNPEAAGSQATFENAVHTAIDLGYNFFDTAPAYGNGVAEVLLGNALRNRRDKVVLATKCAWQVDSPSEIEMSLVASLSRLQTDYVDLLQLHGGYEDLFSLADTRQIVEGPAVTALRRLKEDGRIRFCGITCEYPAALIPLVESGVFDTVQLKYNLAYQEAFHKVLPLCEQLNIGVLAMRPSTSRILDKYLAALGSSTSGKLNTHELSINYVLSDPRVHSAIVGTRSAASVRSNALLSDQEHLRVDLEWLHERRVSGAEQSRSNFSGATSL